MEKFALQGEVQLNGQIQASGAKNAALPILAAAVLCRGTSIIHRVPDLSDVRAMLSIMRSLGAEVSFSDHTVTVNSDRIVKNQVGAEAMQEMRASVLLLGALLARCHQARAAYPGGCSIGMRPVDLHIKAFRHLGAEICERCGVIEAKAHKFSAGRIRLDFPSVGATENAVLVATAAEGVTVIENAAREPEIGDMIRFLRRAGAVINGEGSSVIVVEGGHMLQACEYTVMPDRIETGTFLLAGAVTGGDVTVVETDSRLLTAFLDKLRAMGAEIVTKPDAIRIQSVRRCRSIYVQTQPYPGFPTDLQAPMLAALTTADGVGYVTETIFENRFQQVAELCRMGAMIRVAGSSAVVRGVSRLHGAEVKAPDLRAGAALLLAALNAEGQTIVSNIQHIERGYEKIEEKLRALGAQISRRTGLGDCNDER